MPLPSTILGVIDQLDEIIALEREERSALVYFPLLYRKVTLKVQEGILAGRFQDGSRMELLDVVFANRYIDGYRKYKVGAPVSESWKISFEAGSNNSLILMQHLFLGMNAHINLDLGVAAAQICPGEAIHSLKDDFKEINDLLSEMIEEVQDGISKISPLMTWLDNWAGGIDERIAQFGLKANRSAAWMNALNLASKNQEEFPQAIRNLDQITHKISQLILKPSTIASGLMKLILWFEIKDYDRKIQFLK